MSVEDARWPSMVISVLVHADDSAPSSSTRTGTASDGSQPSTSGRKSAYQLAAEHQQEVAVLQDLLQSKELHNLPKRLSNNEAELIRC